MEQENVSWGGDETGLSLQNGAVENSNLGSAVWLNWQFLPNEEFALELFDALSRRRRLKVDKIKWSQCSLVESSFQKYGVFQFASGGEEEALITKTNLPKPRDSRLANFAEALAGKFPGDLKVVLGVNTFGGNPVGWPCCCH
ncbi:respiratory burst oxidase homolog [Striga asiatica]|uniref:Respiratory burst oxidase homolog n=1 Tax=Striga asiatica TaxID=4170 RepID=A0A5A7QI50_STRAF|nr:respiratory burst oxidase homolog [Striga asiatica]